MRMRVCCMRVLRRLRACGRKFVWISLYTSLDTKTYVPTKWVRVLSGCLIVSMDMRPARQVVIMYKTVFRVDVW